MSNNKKIQRGTTSDSCDYKVYEIALPYMVLSRDDLEEHKNCTNDEFQLIARYLEELLMDYWSNCLHQATRLVLGE
jgi:hypothetical protein